MKREHDPLIWLENSKIVSNISDKGFLAVEKYWPKYHFERGIGNIKGWNNETDAFRHVWEAAYTSEKYGELISKIGMSIHEINGKNHYGQLDNEENMDKWNNQVGYEIGNEIRQKFKSIRNYFSDEQIEDFIAHEVMVRMNAGDLITHPDDPRKFKDYEKIKKRKEELLNTRTISNYQRQSVPIELLKNKKGFYAGFVNSENGSDRIYSIEDVGGMTDEEYSSSRKVLHAQISKIGLPSNRELRHASTHGGGAVYVHSYTRSGSISVRSHYRSAPSRH